MDDWPRNPSWLAAPAGAAILSLSGGWSRVAEDLTLDERTSRLFELLRDPIYRYLVSSFGSPADAEEITQETFLQLYRVLRDGGHIENVRAWLFRVAHNLALNRLAHDRFVEPIETVTWDELCAIQIDERPNPEQRAIEQERWRSFVDGVRQLSPQQRQCLLLRVEGLRYREIADVLGVSVSTVAESLRRGITKLTRNRHV